MKKCLSVSPERLNERAKLRNYRPDDYEVLQRDTGGVCVGPRTTLTTCHSRDIALSSRVKANMYSYLSEIDVR